MLTHIIKTVFFGDIGVQFLTLGVQEDSSRQINSAGSLTLSKFEVHQLIDRSWVYPGGEWRGRKRDADCRW